MAAEEKNKNKKEKALLIICADVDNDLGQKTGITGPVIGREENFQAASKLALADPEEEDANTMFAAIKIYDEFSKKRKTEIVTLTGTSGSYSPGLEISKQLKETIKKVPSESCIFVSDGASDQTVLPIIQSFLKVEDVRIVNVRQAKEMESAYITLVEKLKEPHFARIFFGIPAVLLLLVGISYLLGYGLILPTLLLGTYLLIKGFGIEDLLLRFIRGFGFSTKRVSFVFYFSALLTILLSLFVGASYFYAASQRDYLFRIASSIQIILIFAPLTIVLFTLGKITDAKLRKQELSQPMIISFFESIFLAWVGVYLFVLWIAAKIYFSELLLGVFVASAAFYVMNILNSSFIKYLLKQKNIIGAEVLDRKGEKIGRIVAANIKKGIVRVKSNFGTYIEVPFENIYEFGKNVVIDISV